MRGHRYRISLQFSLLDGGTRQFLHAMSVVQQKTRIVANWSVARVTEPYS